MTPSFRVIHQLPTPIDSSSALSSNVQHEYPSAAFISPQVAVVADGNGLLYVIPIRDNNDVGSEPVGVFTLPSGVPFRLHHLHRAGPATVILLLSSRYYSEDLQKNKPGPVAFDIWAVKVDLFSLRSTGITESRPFEVLWHRRGEDVPVYTTFVNKLNAHLIIGGSSYRDPKTPQKVASTYHEPTPDEMAPIPRANENLDASPSDQEKKFYPYSWTQSSDSVTVAFPLPSTTPKTAFKVFFTTQTLTVHVDNNNVNNDELTTPTTLPIPIPIPHYSAKALWADINPSSSFWTWDREGEQKWGLLTLHMEKKHEGTRWMHVFNPSPRRPASTTTTPPQLDLKGSGSDVDIEVPETLDPSELWHIRESLEKYTSALRDGEDASGLGLGKGLSSLADGEMDEEVDANVGRRVRLTWVRGGGGGMDTNEIAAESEGAAADQVQEEDDEQFVHLLSTPLPGSLGLEQEDDVSLILKHDLDGTVFTLQSSSSKANHNTTWSTPQWIHTSTYSALSFVLASKQDTRFTHHLFLPSSDSNSPSGGAVLAFEGGSSRGRGGNLYIYRSVPTRKEKWAKQAVLKVDDGLGGALLGVGCIMSKGGEKMVVCLTEGELVVIQGI